MKTQFNSVHLEGPVFSCVINESVNKLTASVGLVTGTRCKSGDGFVYRDKMIHQVRIVTSRTGETAERLKAISKDCETNREKFKDSKTLPTTDIIAVNGEITMNDRKETFVFAKGESVSFPEKMKSGNNRMNLKGKVVETAANNSYATAIVVTESSFGKTILPMIVNNKENPQGWAQLTSGKIEKGDTLKISGPIVSQTYNNGKESIYRISVKGTKFESLKKNNTKKTTQVTI